MGQFSAHCGMTIWRPHLNSNEGQMSLLPQLSMHAVMELDQKGPQRHSGYDSTRWKVVPLKFELCFNDAGEFKS